MLLDDPNSQIDSGNVFDKYFLAYYTIEMAFKIFGLGFILEKESYMRNYWNVFDFAIVILGYVPYVFNTENVLLFSGFRILRPLKAVSSLKSLKLILETLFSAFPIIMNAILILVSFLMIYAAIALNLFSGVLKRRCFEKNTGLLIQQTFDNSYIGYLCGYDACPLQEEDRYICGKQMMNPNSDVTNFDNILWSLLMVFQGITLENWSVNMYYVARTVHYYVVIFFISLAFIGGYVLLSLLASVINKEYQKKLDFKTNLPVNDMNYIELDQLENWKLLKKSESELNMAENFMFTERKSDPGSLRIPYSQNTDLQSNMALSKFKLLKSDLLKNTKSPANESLKNRFYAFIAKMVEKFKKYRVIDFMLMVDSKAKYESLSEQDVFEHRVMKMKLLAKEQEEREAKECKYYLEYTNFLDFSKEIQKIEKIEKTKLYKELLSFTKMNQIKDLMKKSSGIKLPLMLRNKVFLVIEKSAKLIQRSKSEENGFNVNSKKNNNIPSIEEFKYECDENSDFEKIRSLNEKNDQEDFEEIKVQA